MAIAVWDDSKSQPEYRRTLRRVGLEVVVPEIIFARDRYVGSQACNL